MWKTSFAVLFMVTLAACDAPSSWSLGKKGVDPTQRITVAYALSPQSTLIHVALANGYFTGEGLDIQSSMHTYGKLALQSVVERKADIALVAETPIMFSVLRGDKIFVLASIESSNTNNAVVARTDAGIAVPGDLKGKRVGFTPGTTSDFYLDSLLTAQGLTRKEILAVPLKPEEMQEAIVTKKVDAVSTWNYPLALIKQQLGAGGKTLYDPQIYTEFFTITARQDFVTGNPETVKKFLRALITAEKFVAENPEAAQAILATATKIDEKLIQDVWGTFGYHVALDQGLRITLEDETRWAMENKLTDKTVMPDYNSYIYLDGLKSIKPEAIRMNR